MAFFIFLAIVAAAAFAYLVYSHGWKAAVAGVAGAGAALWAALQGFAGLFHQ